MHIRLEGPLAEWVAQQVTSGRYASETAVVEDALAARIEQDQSARQADGEALRDRLRESVSQADRGKVVRADDTFFERLRERVSTGAGGA